MKALFLEEYRPKTREEIVGNEKTLEKIFSIVRTRNIPHLILEGPSGVGKTTTALVIAKTLFGEFFKPNFREINASDESGIAIVRNEIKTFCKTAPLGADFKILFLDESERISNDAQEALRRIMEKYSNVTRFIISCNDVSKIIEPIQSRCEIFHFSPLKKEDISSRLSFIAEKASIEIDRESVDFLSELADGDMRKAINKLQVLASFGVSIKIKFISEYESSANPSKGIIVSLSKGRFLESRNVCKDLLLDGYSERAIVNNLHKELIHNETIPAIQKGDCILELAESDYRLTLGVSKGLQLDSILLKLIKILKH